MKPFHFYHRNLNQFLTIISSTFSIIIPLQITLESQYLGLVSLQPHLIKFWCLHSISKLPFWKWIWFPFGSLITCSFWFTICSELTKRFSIVLMDEKGLTSANSINKKKKGTLRSYWIISNWPSFLQTNDYPSMDKIYLFGKWTDIVVNWIGNWELPFIIDLLFNNIIGVINLVMKNDKNILVMLKSFLEEQKIKEEYDLMDDLVSETKGL